MTTINKSMFPVQSGMQHISSMKARFEALQGQLATGKRHASLAEMGMHRYTDLAMRARIERTAGYQSNITTVELRLEMLDKTMQRFDKIEGEQRTMVSPGAYGSSNVNFANVPQISASRLDEVLNLLNVDLNGRYLMGGSTTDRPPVKMLGPVLDGEGGRAGFRTIVNERQLADAGADGLGRLALGRTDATVSLADDQSHSFGFKLLEMTASGSDVTASVADGVVFAGVPAAGATVTLRLALPDGTEAGLTLTATEGTAGPGAFQLGADAETTAESFRAALERDIKALVDTDLAAASTFAAAENFFNASGEPILRVDGSNPQSATALRVATPGDTVQWYAGETSGIGAPLGRLEIATTGATSVLNEAAPVAEGYGFRLAGISASTAAITTADAETSPNALTIEFGDVPAPGEAVTITLTAPDGSRRELTLAAVEGRAGPGEFSIGADAAETARNFDAALEAGLRAAATAAAGNPRDGAQARIDDATTVSYGVRANESGLLELVRTLAAMSVTTYSDADATSTGRFDAMAERQGSRLSEGRNSEPGSIEILSVELGLAKARTGSVSERLTTYNAHLETMLEGIEGVSEEEVAMEMLALQTRLTASYQATALIAGLSLVNFLK